MGCKNVFDDSLANFSQSIHSQSNKNTSFFLNKFFTKSSIDTFDKQSFKLSNDSNEITKKTLEFAPSPLDPFEFKCNKPFVYIVHDNVYDNILFIGRYVKPLNS
jgi:serine protease inhibitor